MVETATSLGLTVLDEQLGMAFLPGGKVVPDERRALWEGLRREMSESNEPAVTKAGMRKAMATFLREAVTTHGFEHDPANDRADVTFTRSTPAGRQTIDLKIEGALPRLECAIYCMQRNETVESINDAALGPRAASPDTFAFNVGSFVGVFNHGLPFAGKKEIEAIFALVESKPCP